jgi:hypothetical protein
LVYGKSGTYLFQLSFPCECFLFLWFQKVFSRRELLVQLSLFKIKHIVTIVSTIFPLKRKPNETLKRTYLARLLRRRERRVHLLLRLHLLLIPLFGLPNRTFRSRSTCRRTVPSTTDADLVGACESVPVRWTASTLMTMLFGGLFGCSEVSLLEFCVDDEARRGEASKRGIEGKLVYRFFED